MNAAAATVNASRWSVVGLIALLAACSGTIKPDTRVQGDASRVEGVAQVSTLIGPAATQQLADSPQFNRDELTSYTRRRLEGKGLLTGAATHRVEITVTDLRVRSTAAAVIFGFMAGDDHVNGRVRILDERNRAVRSFDVQASYAFGGWAGGDGIRMNWLYDKFSELAVSELEKVIQTPRETTPVLAAPSEAAMSARAPAEAPVGMPVPIMRPASASASTNANRPALDRVDEVPGLNDYGRNMYRDWLTRRPPRAFVVASDGRSNATWGTHPKDPADPTDPAERALKQCRALGRPGCTLYAVDDRVVYQRTSSDGAAPP